MSENRLNGLIDNLQELENLKKDLEKQIEVIKNEITENMDQIEELKTDRFLIRYTLSERNTIDGKSLKEYSQDLYNKFLKSTYYRRFSYKAL